MGTKVHCKSYLPSYYSMRDLNEDSSSSSWPLFYGDNGITNGQYYNGFATRNIIDGHLGSDKDALKQKMLEHEAIFKNQVYELHRLYRIQRDMMEDAKRKELHRRVSMEPSSSSSLQGPHLPSEDTRKWHMAGFPLLNSINSRPSMSPMSCTKANNTQTGWLNGSILKGETLDSRPMKVRKKLFDLQLPADEYIDTEEGEKLQDHRLTKTSASASCLRNSIGLADLNEPVQIEEPMTPSSVDFLGHTSVNGEIKGMNQIGKSNASHLGVARETTNVRDGFLITSSIESRADERERLSQVYEAGHNRSSLSSAPQGRRHEKLPLSSNPIQSILNPVHHPPGFYATGYNREDDLATERIHRRWESSDMRHDYSSNTQLEPLLPSQAPSSFPFFNSPHFSTSGTQSVSSWKPSSFAQKVNTFDSSLSSAVAMDRSLQPFGQSREPFGGKWGVGCRLNPGSGSEMTMPNGFYHGSASGSRELHGHFPSAGFNYRNCSRGENLASDRSANHGYGDFSVGSRNKDLRPAIDINLNEAISKSSSNEVVILQDLNVVDRSIKPEDNLFAPLPWLKPKPAHDNDGAYMRRSELSNQLNSKGETVRDLNQLFTPTVTLASSDCEIVRGKEIGETQNVKRILGFPIFEAESSKIEPSALAFTKPQVDFPLKGKDGINERGNRIIDINLECEPDEQIAAEELNTEKEKQRNCIRDYIDLNSCIDDSEEPAAPSIESKSDRVKVTLDINLEAPVFPETEEDNVNAPSIENVPNEVPLQCSENKNEKLQENFLKSAAETLVAISSYHPQTQDEDNDCHPSEASMAESFLLFVDAVCSTAGELESASAKGLLIKDSQKQDSSEEMDDFEVMTLQMAVTKEEDYMPKPFVPEIQQVEEAGPSTVTTRSRRGQARRGRQRRDFQRDILPGLVSLSRHEVTEDLQTFGGLMKATGHSWSSGLTRRNGTRNGGGRGRRRAAAVEPARVVVPTPVCTQPMHQQLNVVEGGLEDRSLTGWGKTTRRPRRQRCPAGNPPTIVSI